MSALPQDRLTLVGPLSIDPYRRIVRVDGELVDLPRKEYALLLILASEPCRTFTKRELLRDVWDIKAPSSTRTLDSHMSRLRRHLGVRGHKFGGAVWGTGYRLIDPARGLDVHRPTCPTCGQEMP